MGYARSLFARKMAAAAGSNVDACARLKRAGIAFLTGFSEQSFFTRAFRRRVGETPANYRRQIRLHEA
ncbi:helix-turn-helix domain-containing protein [Roseobacter ponti]